jgi:hypothetical protein
VIFIDPLDPKRATASAAGSTAEQIYAEQKPAADAFGVSREDYLAAFRRLNPGQ